MISKSLEISLRKARSRFIQDDDFAFPVQGGCNGNHLLVVTGKSFTC
jgi:hypothetical protein